MSVGFGVATGNATGEEMGLRVGAVDGLSVGFRGGGVYTITNIGDCVGSGVGRRVGFSFKFKGYVGMR